MLRVQDRNLEEYYRARAGEYEQIYYRDMPERRREIDDEAERLKTLVNGRAVLELACGTGYWTHVMATTAREITALDLSGEMLTEARKKEYDTPVRFLKADMFSYDADRLYDIVAVGFWFSHHPRQAYEDYFDVLRRFLASKGAIWMIDNNPPAEGHDLDSVCTDEHGNNFKRRYLDDGTEFVILKNYFSEEDLRAIFEKRFAIESLIHKTYYWSAVLKLGR